MKKKTRISWFFPTMHLDFLCLNDRNPLLFIRGGRGTSCLYRGPILALDSSKKDLNRWLMICKN